MPQKPGFTPDEPDAGKSFKAAPLAIAAVAVALLVLGGAVGASLAYVLANDDGHDMDMDMGATPELGTELRQTAHEHADFLILVRGQPLDLAREQFLSTEDIERSPNVHLHAPRTSVIHLHREQTTWDEFLRSLGMELNDDCLTLDTGERLCSGRGEKLRFVVNGVPVDTLQFVNIAEMSRTLITFGSGSGADALEQFTLVSDQACIPSETCADRIEPADLEKEPCRKSTGVCH